MMMCPYCGNKNEHYMWEQFEHLENNLTYYEQSKLALELRDLGFKIMVCEECCQAFIVKDN